MYLVKRVFSLRFLFSTTFISGKGGKRVYCGVHDRMHPESHRIWVYVPPERLSQKRMERARFYHRGHWVIQRLLLILHLMKQTIFIRNLKRSQLKYFIYTHFPLRN